MIINQKKKKKDRESKEHKYSKRRKAGQRGLPLRKVAESLKIQKQQNTEK